MGDVSASKNRNTLKTRKKRRNSNENTLDNYISRSPSGVRWWDENDIEHGESTDSSKKYEFLKKNVKASSVIPKKLEEVSHIPDKLGSFSFSGGTLEVGYDKFPRTKNNTIVFSVLPETYEDRKSKPTKSFDDENNYFGGLSSRKSNRFEASVISVKGTTHSTSNIKKLEDDHDAIPDHETKLLYQDKQENDEIRDLKTQKNRGADFEKIDKAIAKIDEVKEEKKKDNLAFLKAIDNFMNQLRRGKLRKYVDSDDFIIRRKRIIELSSSPNLDVLELNELRRLLKEILEREEFYKKSGMLSESNINCFTEEQLRSILKALLNI